MKLLTLLSWGALVGAVPGADAAASPPAFADTLQLVGELHVDGRPAQEGTVTLHRVTPEEAGPVDSASVGTDGRFTLTLPTPPRGGAMEGAPDLPDGDPDVERLPQEAPEPGGGEVYFASVRHEEILYYGPPLADPEQLDDDYVIEAYSAEPAEPDGEPFRVAHRQLLLQEVDGVWRATDILEVENDQDRTFVPAGGDGTVWRHPLPVGAERFQVGEGDLPADQAVHAEGEVRVSAPMTPGRRLFVFLYDLHRLDEGVPLGGPTDSLEVFLREPAPEVEMEGLERVEGTEPEPGVTFRRLVGAELEPGLMAWEEVEGNGASPRVEHLVVALTLVLAGVAIWLLLAFGKPVRPRTASPERSEGSALEPAGGEEDGGDRHANDELLAAIAALDESHAGGGVSDEEYRARRAELLARLSQPN